jgi:hypothetical protein
MRLACLGEFFRGSQDHVYEMRANAEPLDILHDQFIEWHRNHPTPVDSYAENIGLFRTRRWRRPLPFRLVVPRASANPGIAGHTVRDVDDDHLTIVKPRDRKHDVYAGVLRLVRDALTEVPARRVDVTPKATHVSEAAAASLCLEKQYPFETVYRALDAPAFPQLLYAAAFWSLLVNISAVTLDSRMSPVIQGLPQDLNHGREALINTWVEAFKGGIEMSFSDWHKQWTQATKHARRNRWTRSKQAEVDARYKY